jgi:hypothetical protein
VCIWGGSSPGLTDSLHRERETLYTTERQEIIATPGVLLLLLLLPLPSLTTSSCREIDPTCLDSRSKNSEGNNRPDTVVGLPIALTCRICHDTQYRDTYRTPKYHYILAITPTPRTTTLDSSSQCSINADAINAAYTHLYQDARY